MKINQEKLFLAQCESGLTGTEISARAGIPQQQFSAVLRRGSCHPKTLAAIANALNIDILDLVHTDEREDN